MLTFFSQWLQLMSVQLLLASSSFSNASSLWFKHVFRREYVYDGTFLRLEPRRCHPCHPCPLSPCRFRAPQQSELKTERGACDQCYEKSILHLTLDKYSQSQNLACYYPWSVDKNHTMWPISLPLRCFCCFLSSVQCPHCHKMLWFIPHAG